MPAKTKVRAKGLERGDVVFFEFGGREERGIVECANLSGVGVRVAELGSLVWLRPEHRVRPA